jgi:hypothetical protein
MINFINYNVFIVLYVSYVILLFKNILGTYVVMSSIFKMRQGVKLLCNDPGKSASHICAITPKGLVNLELP